MTTDALLETAFAAMQAGRWQEAGAAFEAILREADLPEACAGLRDVLFWTGEVHRSLDYGERAYVLHRRGGNMLAAAEAAYWLCMLYQACLGNVAAARGWLARTESILAETDAAGPLEGWLHLGRAMFETDNARARELIELGLAAARAIGDIDMELCALSELGVVLVKLGEIDEGMRGADEAMAAALGGEATVLDTVVMTSCAVLTACDLVGDIDRAVQWSRAADEFTRTYGGPYLHSSCRMVYARVLVITGRWAEAERELATGLAGTKETFPGMYNRITAILAELRLRQGRTDEAAVLIENVDAPVETAIVAAGIALRRGEAPLAVALIERWLHAEADEVSPPLHAGGRGISIETVCALCLLVEAHLASGDVPAAADVAVGLTVMASAGSARLVAAHAAYARGRIASVEGAAATAVSYFEDAMERFAGLELPLEAARARIELTRVLAPSQPQLAVAEARAALVAFDRLGASSEADAAAALLRSWGVAGRTGPREAGLLTKREQEILSLLAAGLSNQEIAERLYISRRTAAHHVGNLLAKLGLRNRTEAAAYASREKGPRV